MHGNHVKMRVLIYNHHYSILSLNNHYFVLENPNEQALVSSLEHDHCSFMTGQTGLVSISKCLLDYAANIYSS